MCHRSLRIYTCGTGFSEPLPSGHVSKELLPTAAFLFLFPRDLPTECRLLSQPLWLPSHTELQHGSTPSLLLFSFNRSNVRSIMCSDQDWSQLLDAAGAPRFSRYPFFFCSRALMLNHFFFAGSQNSLGPDGHLGSYFKTNRVLILNNQHFPATHHIPTLKPFERGIPNL